MADGGPHASRGSGRVRRALAIVVLAALAPACRSSGGPAPTDAAQPSVYFVSEAGAWELREAYKPRPDDPVTSRTEPTLDWYAEHERFPDPNRSEAVRLSGHHVAIAELEATLAGFDLRGRKVHDLDARVGSGPDGPRLVLLPVAARYTVMALSYELPLDRLVEWTNALRAVDEAGWMARGGLVAR